MNPREFCEGDELDLYEGTVKVARVTYLGPCGQMSEMSRPSPDGSPSGFGTSPQPAALVQMPDGRKEQVLLRHLRRAVE
ncbi:MAG: hypothetical protein J5J06_05135 [Phycisphaerae bacterium]|nr:hypothetical protein [Phycisphaerae bacterium]